MYKRKRLQELGIGFECQRTFDYSCVKPHDFFVILCKKYTFFKSLFGSGNFKFDCRCYQLTPMEYCSNCVNIQYLLNFVADKICLSHIPEELKERLVSIEEFLKDIPCEPFFYFYRNEQIIQLSLNSPGYNLIIRLKKNWQLII